MRLEVISPRWLEYMPRGTCQWSALPAIGAVASLGGTFMSMQAQKQESSYQEAVARNQEILDRQKANEDAAIGERAAITEKRKTDLALSRGLALAAASGTDAASAGTLDLQGDVAQQGGYNALSALYEGIARSRSDVAQADIDLFNQQRIRSAAPLVAAGTLLGGISRAAASAYQSRDQSRDAISKLFGT